MVLPLRPSGAGLIGGARTARAAIYAPAAAIGEAPADGNHALKLNPGGAGAYSSVNDNDPLALNHPNAGAAGERIIAPRQDLAVCGRANAPSSDPRALALAAAAAARFTPPAPSALGQPVIKRPGPRPLGVGPACCASFLIRAISLLGALTIRAVAPAAPPPPGLGPAKSAPSFAGAARRTRLGRARRGPTMALGPRDHRALDQ